jgi:hypothetical protein
MSDGDLPLKRINVRDFRFNEIYSATQHRVTQIKQNVVLGAFTKRESHERGIENKFPAAGNERDLVFVAQQSRQTLRCNHTTKTATEY